MSKVIDIVVKAKDATASAFKKVAKNSEKMRTALAKGFGGAGKAIKGLAVGIALVGSAAIAAAKHFIGFASAAEEIETKFEAVYASTLTAANVIAGDLASSFDLADSTAKEMLSNIGDLLTGFGFTGAEALAMADKVSRLGIDLASFTNYSKGASGATEALTKLLLGETEQAKSLGIVVRQGSDEYKGRVAALQEMEGVSLLQAKAMTALAMATEQSKNALGDYDRTQDGVANRQRKVEEAFKAAKEEVGEAIIKHSGYAAILNLVAEKTKALTEGNLIELWAQNVVAALKFMMPSFEKLGGKIGKVAGVVVDVVGRSAAYLGARAGGASHIEANEIGMAEKGRKARVKKERLDEIQAKKDEEAAAKAILDKKKEAAALATETAEKEAADKAAADKKAAADAETEAKEKDKRDKKRADDQVKLAEVKEKIQDVRNKERQDQFGKVVQQNDEVIAKNRDKIANLAMNKDERREKLRQERAIKRDDNKEKMLRKKMKRTGFTLSKDGAAFIAKRDAELAIAIAEEDIKNDKENARLLGITMAAQARKKMVESLENIEAGLEANLKAGA